MIEAFNFTIDAVDLYCFEHFKNLLACQIAASQVGLRAEILRNALGHDGPAALVV